GNVEPAIDLRAVDDHVGPVEVDVLLLDPRNVEAVIAILDLHHVLFGAERQREGVGVQIAGMHGIGEVVVDKAIAAAPATHAKNAAPGGVRELRRNVERRRLRTLLAREIDKDAVVRLEHGIAVDRLAAFERATRHRRHAYDGAGAVERHAVIAAGDIVRIDLAAREPRAAMRTVVLEAVQLALRVAPEHEIAPERFHRVRLVALSPPRFLPHVTLTRDPGGEALPDLVP